MSETTQEPRDITARPALSEEVPLLARLNRQLIVDEGSRNPMTLAELEQRMRTWLAGGWHVLVVEQSGQTVAYIVFQVRHDEYEPSHTEIHVRQFFVNPECRNRGIGRRSFDMIAEEHFPQGASVALDVLEVNRNARRFWESLGFLPYATTLRRSP